MTRHEFYKTVQKLEQDYVPSVKDECVALGYDEIKLTCSEEQLATTSNVRGASQVLRHREPCRALFSQGCRFSEIRG